MTSQPMIVIADSQLAVDLAPHQAVCRDVDIAFSHYAIHIRSPLGLHQLAQLRDKINDPMLLESLSRAVYAAQARTLLTRSDAQLVEWVRDAVEQCRWSPVPECPSFEESPEAFARTGDAVGAVLRDRLIRAISSYVGRSVTDQGVSPAGECERVLPITWLKLALIRRFNIVEQGPWVRSLLVTGKLPERLVGDEPFLHTIVRTLAIMPGVDDIPLLKAHMETAALTLDCFRGLVAYDSVYRELFWSIMDSAEQRFALGEIQGLAETYLLATGEPLAGDGPSGNNLSATGGGLAGDGCRALQRLLFSTAPRGPNAAVIAGFCGAIKRVFNATVSVYTTTVEKYGAGHGPAAPETRASAIIARSRHLSRGTLEHDIFAIEIPSVHEELASWLATELADQSSEGSLGMEESSDFRLMVFEAKLGRGRRQLAGMET
jgi:hypothetical protein